MMALKKTAFLSLLLLFTNALVKAQAPFFIELTPTTVADLSSRFYVANVIDGRKDTLNNGFAIINKKKTTVTFPGGVPFQFQQYFDSFLPAPDSLLLPAIIRIKKFILSERATTKGNILKADITIQFLRKDYDELTQLFELSTWMEQSALKDASKLQEKNIKDILNRMLKQFNQLLTDHPDDPLLTPKIVFKVVHPEDENPMDDTIFWSSSRKLAWDDFKGQPGNELFAAQSNCAFAQLIEPVAENGLGIFYINVRAAFLKKGSWVKKDQDNFEVLLHEQLHFDIAEWQIRQLRKDLMVSNLTLSNYSELINKLYNDAWNRYNSIQSDYDLETVHGTIKAEQEKWNTKVKNELNGLKDFE